jgi:hypothetical protein
LPCSRLEKDLKPATNGFSEWYGSGDCHNQRSHNQRLAPSSVFFKQDTIDSPLVITAIIMVCIFFNSASQLSQVTWLLVKYEYESNNVKLNFNSLFLHFFVEFYTSTGVNLNLLNATYGEQSFCSISVANKIFEL